MAPPITPSPAYRTDLSPSHIRLRPTGTDDWDNIQDAINDLSGVEGALLELTGGTFYHRYQIEMIDPLLEMRGRGVKGTTLIAGLAAAPILPLDTFDRLQAYSPTGWPFQFLIHPAPGGAAPAELHIHSMTIQTGADGVLGATGFVFGGFDARNLHAHAVFGVFTSELSCGVMDESVVLTGLDGASPTSLAYTNIGIADGRRAWVFSAIDNTGTEYVEGVDFTVNDVLGTITRITGTTIPNAATVYVTYNRPTSSNPINRIHVHAHDLHVRGTVRLNNANGTSQSSVDNAFYVQNAGIVFMAPSQAGLQFTAALTSLGGAYATVRTDYAPGGLQDTGDFLPVEAWNGVVDVHDCTFEDMSHPMLVTGGHGVPIATGGYSFAGCRPRNLIRYVDNEEINAHSHELWWLNVFGTGTGGDYVIEGNITRNCGAFIREFLGVADAVGKTAPVGFFGNLNSYRVADNRVLGWRVVPDQFGGFQQRAFLATRFDAVPAQDDFVSYDIQGNELELVDGDSFRNGVLIDSRINADISNNKFVTNKRAAGQAPIRVTNGAAKIALNDFSGYMKQDGQADIRLDGASAGVIVQAFDNDLIRDDGTGNVISGGTIE